MRSKLQRIHKLQTNVPSPKETVLLSNNPSSSSVATSSIAPLPTPSINECLSNLKERVPPINNIINLMKEIEEWRSGRDHNRFNNQGLLESYLQPSLWLNLLLDFLSALAKYVLIPDTQPKISKQVSVYSLRMYFYLLMSDS